MLVEQLLTGPRFGPATQQFTRSVQRFAETVLPFAERNGSADQARETKSMVFVQGQLDQENQPILMFSSVARKITPRINVG